MKIKPVSKHFARKFLIVIYILCNTSTTPVYVIILNNFSYILRMQNDIKILDVAKRRK